MYFECVAGRCIRFWYNVENAADKLTVKLYDGKVSEREFCQIKKSVSFC